MTDAFDDQRFRDEIEALALAICDIRRHAAPDRSILDAIVQREFDQTTARPHPGAQSLTLDTIVRLLQAIARWRDETANSAPFEPSD